MTTTHGSAHVKGTGTTRPRWKFWEQPVPTSQTATADRAPVSGNATNGAAAVVTSPALPPVDFTVEHRTHGRLRLSIPRLARDADYADRLQRWTMATGMVSGVRINSVSRSLVVEYDWRQHAEPDILARLAVGIQAATDPALAIEPLAMIGDAEHGIDYVKRLALPGTALALGVGTLGGLAFPPVLIGGVLLAAALPSFRRAWSGIRHERKLNVDFLDSTAIVLLTTSGFFFPPALMIGLIESGEIIRDLTARRTARANLDLLDSLGKVARVERDGVEVEVPLAEVVVGDIVVVYPGDQIPVDGKVLSGVGLVDQHKLTGESIPVTREEGQDVLAATLLVDGVLRIDTRRTGNNTRAGLVVALMKAAPVHDTRMEDYARKIGDRIVIPTLALGGAVTVATGGNVIAGVGVITLDIGTGVRVSVPTAILASLMFAARNGILIRSGRAIEQLAKVDCAVFDKTGTLTQGKAGVVGIYSERADITAVDVLQLAATAEQGLTHPVAEAIVRHAREQGIGLKECETWEYRVGQGIIATIDGRRIIVGSHRMMVMLGVETDSIRERHPAIEASAASQVYVATDTDLLGVILYKDPARPESPGVIAGLEDLAITPYMLSGDITAVANAIAAELGIAPEHVYAEAFPERKVEVVKALQESGKTIAFVGDGINDSAALAHASVSISFAGATDMARETADIVLMDDDLSSLLLAIRIARQAMSVVRQNAGIVVGPNVSAMVWAALIGLNPVAAVLINNGSAIVAEMNGFRPLLGPPGWDKLKAQRAARADQAADPHPMALLGAGVNGHASNALPSDYAVEVATSADRANGHHHDQPDAMDSATITTLAPVTPGSSANGVGDTNGHHNGAGDRAVLPAMVMLVSDSHAAELAVQANGAGSHDVVQDGASSPIDMAPVTRRGRRPTRPRTGAEPPGDLTIQMPLAASEPAPRSRRKRAVAAPIASGISQD